eukprot:4079295-Prorocentrum_lima.AAC.1
MSAGLLTMEMLKEGEKLQGSGIGTKNTHVKASQWTMDKSKSFVCCASTDDHHSDGRKNNSS